MRAHAVSGQEDDNAGYQIPLWRAAALPAQPDPHQSRTPPDDAHARVLEIVSNPGGAPPVFGEGVDTPPCRDDDAIEELLAPSGAVQPRLADEKENGQHDAVADECRSHNEVRQTLSEVVALAEADGDDPAKEELHPCSDGQSLTNEAMSCDQPWTDCAQYAALEMES